MIACAKSCVVDLALLNLANVKVERLTLLEVGVSEGGTIFTSSL